MTSKAPMSPARSGSRRWAQIAVLGLVLGLAGCDQRPLGTAPQSPVPPPEKAAPTGPQAQPDASATPRAQASGLPDFTVLVERQGPAVVNVVTTRARGGGSGPEAADDPLSEF